MGGGFGLLGVQVLGVLAVGAFVFVTSGLVWLALKHTVGIRVSRAEELAGLDIGRARQPGLPRLCPPPCRWRTWARRPCPPPPRRPYRCSRAVPVEHRAAPGALTKLSIVTNQARFAQLQKALEELGVTGMTVTNVFGYGVQKGHEATFRGLPIEARLLPKLKVEVVVADIPVDEGRDLSLPRVFPPPRGAAG